MENCGVCEVMDGVVDSPAGGCQLLLSCFAFHSRNPRHHTVKWTASVCPSKLKLNAPPKTLPPTW